MNISSRLDKLHSSFRKNRWLWYFSIFNRLALAAGFIPSGMVKIMGERFTSLAINHPMGNYLEALHHTGYYYTFIGIMQVTAAILLLIPRTVVLGALIYFPIILNICILSLAVRFDGSLLSSPLMLLANLYILWWNYDKIKPIFPFRNDSTAEKFPRGKSLNNKFPGVFFGAITAFIFALLFFLINVHELMPRNTLLDCKSQFKQAGSSNAGYSFCYCIHKTGKPLKECLELYEQQAGNNTGDHKLKAQGND